MPDDDTRAKTDEELGIRLEPKAGFMVLKIDQQKAVKLENQLEFFKRANEIIDQYVTESPKASEDAYVDLGMEKQFLKDQLRKQVYNNPDTAYSRNPSLKFVTISELSTLSDSFRIQAGMPRSFATTLEKSLSEETKERFHNFLEEHETGHVIGKNFGLREAGADYYAAVQFLKKYPDAREDMQLISDSRLFPVLNFNVPPDDVKYGVGTYLALDQALKLTPQQIKGMDEEETIRRASQFDTLADRNHGVEYDVREDIRREMEKTRQQTGETSTVKQTAEKMLQEDVYATDGKIVGDNTAIKYKTLVNIVGALERLEQRGLTLPDNSAPGWEFEKPSTPAASLPKP